MRKIATFLDLLFGTWLTTVSALAVMRGGLGTLAWPLIPLGMILIAIVCVRFTSRNQLNLASAFWYFTVLLTAVGGILEEYSIPGFFSVERFAEQLALSLAAAVLVFLHVRLWQMRK